MPPFPPVGFVGRGGGIDQSAIRPEGSGRQAEGTTGRVKSKCGTGRGKKVGVERWMDGRMDVGLEERKEGSSSLAELFPLRWVFRWGWLLCQKARCSD